MTFLEHIAELVTTRYDDPREVVVVFPNRRAGLFLKDILRTSSRGPFWSPDIVSLQDLVSRESALDLADPVYLVYRLYQVYRHHLPRSEGESFDRFYYWGKMLLQDFDELDKYLVDAGVMYRNLLQQKELDATFDFMSGEQKEILRMFWDHFEESRFENKDRFLRTWEKLGAIYDDFREALQEEGLAYEGMMYRRFAENIEDHEWRYQRRHVLFAGFNALTSAEEKIIRWCLENGDTRVEWDTDRYYVENKAQEAGVFFRNYRRIPTYEKTFPSPLPDNLSDRDMDLEIIGVPQHIGQARIAGQKLGELFRAHPDTPRHRVAIVLGDESLLLPVLQSLPPDCGPVNVTMGFPLSHAPVNSLIEYLSDNQRLYRQGRGFYYLPAKGILNHPLIASRWDEGPALIRKAEKNNQVYFREEEFENVPLIGEIFRDGGEDFLGYLNGILKLFESDQSLDDMNRTFIHHYRKHFVRYADILGQEDQIRADVHMFRRLFRQLANTEKVPFTGEPLRGIQIMGVLETRNLDFDHVFLLSCNEGNLPSGARQHSFIPYNIRKAYELPHFDQQDAMYAYLFYRLLHHVKTAVFTWDTEGNEFGEEEMSRYLKQLLYEFPRRDRVKQRVLAHPASTESPAPIVIGRTARVKEMLNRYLDPDDKARLSASALNTYLECRLRFYFKSIARLYEPEEIEEDLDARTLGNVLHHLMEHLYQDHLNTKGPRMTKEDIKNMEKTLPELLHMAFRKYFQIDEGEFSIEGKNRIAGEIVLDFARKILERDAAYAPFDLAGLEKRIQITEELKDGRSVRLHGIIDRVDEKDGHLRIIDYKTGKDKQVFETVEALFDDKPNKVAFQTLFYTFLYQRATGRTENMSPNVFNRPVLFQDDSPLLKMGPPRKQKLPVKQAVEVMDTFNEKLRELLNELFFSEQPFDQTDDLKKCEWCEFSGICQRP